MAAVMHEFMVWQDSWLVGVQTIDAQHKKLVSLINQLHEAMRIGQSKTVLTQILASLVDYTRAHFAAEEQLLQTHKYPDLPAHRIEHQKLTSKVLDFQEEFTAGNATLGVDVMQFLSNWLRDHILGTDMKYVPVLRSKISR